LPRVAWNLLKQVNPGVGNWKREWGFMHQAVAFVDMPKAKIKLWVRRLIARCGKDTILQ